NKKLHSISEVKFSRSSTLFDKDPIFTARLFWDISIMESDCPAYAKNRINLQLIANHPVFQFEA
ncbi:hypothetical protein, partial [Ligilactobacillus ruminis]|uniref:hypothetical protein n=1 Tax=Ligilactobacillus ruminis TaxID=1623 RepID=UPI0022E8E38B